MNQLIKDFGIRGYFWQCIVLIVILYTAFEVPFSIVFNRDIKNWNLWLEVCSSGIMLVDLVVNLRSDHPLKFKNKLRKYFYLTLGIFYIIPFEFLGKLTDLDNLFRVFRYIRVFKIFNIINTFSIVGALTVIPTRFKLILAFIGFFIGVQIIACGWIALNQVNETNVFDVYIQALYWTITTLTTVGYGDITPTTTITKIYTMITMILGVGVYGFVIGNVSNMISEANRYNEKSRKKIQDLTNFMNHYKVPYSLQVATLDYYNNLLTKRLSDNDQQIISNLPNVLREELRIYMTIRLIENMKIFKDCSKQCLKEVAYNLKQENFSPMQSVFNFGEIGNELYIINHGEVEILNEDNISLAQLSDGQFFGEKALIEHKTRSASVIASSYCDLYKLDKSDFVRISKKFPELAQNFKSVIERNYI